jgi:hypothetical protein
MNCGRAVSGRALVKIDSGRAEAARAGVKIAFHCYRCPAQLSTSIFHPYPLPTHLCTPPCHRYRDPTSLRLPWCYFVNSIGGRRFDARLCLSTHPCFRRWWAYWCWPGTGSSQTVVTSRSSFLSSDSRAANSWSSHVGQASRRRAAGPTPGIWWHPRRRGTWHRRSRGTRQPWRRGTEQHATKATWAGRTARRSP